MNRLFVPTPVVAGEALWLEGERAHYVGRVLRARPGDALAIFDGGGGEYSGTVADIDRHRIRIAVGEFSADSIESPLHIRLLQGISRGDRMDVVVQKATELGVRRISPVNTEFSVVRLDAARAQKKTDHWIRIGQSACEQCGRNTLPLVDEPADLQTVIAAGCDATRIVLLPDGEIPLSQLSGVGASLTLLVGPEGGLSASESGLVQENGFVACSLGPRILRTETAAIAAIAVLQSRFGDLGGSAA